jgi:Fe2+ transport system protein FeoA
VTSVVLLDRSHSMKLGKYLIVDIDQKSQACLRLESMGFRKGNIFSIVSTGLFGSPVYCEIHNARFALRKEELNCLKLDSLK